MVSNRQSGDNWLHPVTRCRVMCHEITWVDGDQFSTMSAAGDLHFDSIPRCGTVLHSHDFIEILYVNSGAVVHSVNFEPQVLRAGDICFLRPDDVHCFLPAQEFDQVEIVKLDFDLELALALSEYFGEDVFLQQMTASVLPPCFHLDSAAATSLFSRLLRLNAPSLSVQMRGVKLKVLLADLYTQFFVDEQNMLSESQVPEWFEALCAEMRKKENFAGGVKQMQKLAGRTPGHLCKAFKRYLRKTPTEFVNELRINHSAWMLADTSEDILGIVDDLGFQSVSHFYDLFKKTYGMSPANYRRIHATPRIY